MRISRRSVWLGLPVVLLALSGGTAPASEKGATAQSLQVTVDTSEAPDLKKWGEKAAELCRTWHPKIAHALRSDGFIPSRTVRIKFEKACDNPAEASGDRITISPQWVRAHPDDFGMVIHELTHVIQAYPGAEAGWLVEGIADYVRFWQFEPQAPRSPIDPDKASYRDAYRTTAAFLAWTQDRYNPRLVPHLNRDLRADAYTDAAFKSYTGRPLDTLWSEFTQHLRTTRAKRLPQVRPNAAQVRPTAILRADP